MVSRSWSFAFIPHSIAFGMLSILVPLYFVENLKGSILDFAYMSAISILFNILSSVYMGRLPEKYGRTKPFILLSFLLSGILLFAMTRTSNLLLFQIFYVLLGITNSIYGPSIRMLIAETYEKDEWDRMFAWQNLIVGLSGTLGLAFCSIYAPSLGYASLLAFCPPLVLVSLLLGFVSINDPPFYSERLMNRMSRAADEAEALSYWLGSKGNPRTFGLRRDINMAFFGLGTAIFIMAGASAFTSLPIFLSGTVLMTSSTIFAIFFCRSLIGSISYLFIGRVMGSNGEKAVRVASLSRTLLVLSLISLSFLPWSATIVAIILLSLLEVSWSMYAIGNSMVVMENASGGSTGFYDALGNVGNVVGVLLSGAIPTIFSFNILFVMASALYLVGFVFFSKASG
ncbi:MAG: hypothetical protein QG670_2648 [Thermoproteota archaeon]|nr:hypothetical protein [Thermoproteota archaeon]